MEFRRWPVLRYLDDVLEACGENDPPSCLLMRAYEILMEIWPVLWNLECVRFGSDGPFEERNPKDKDSFGWASEERKPKDKDSIRFGDQVGFCVLKNEKQKIRFGWASDLW
ncbi:unnamed protein product [Rhizophagus irregularis]|nr:unnamed protein product [Rhizophagus irregularis]